MIVATMKRAGRLLAGLLLVMAGMATAANLEPARIDAYIASLADVRALGDELKAEGKAAFLAGQIMPAEGDAFDPHSRAVEALQRDEPDYFSRLEALVLEHGFTSAHSWAIAGDRIVLAYGAEKVAAESPQMLVLAAQSGPEQEMLMQALPAPQREQLKQALVIARALAQVPDADRAAVKPYIGQLDTLFGQP